MNMYDPENDENFSALDDNDNDTTDNKQHNKENKKKKTPKPLADRLFFK